MFLFLFFFLASLSFADCVFGDPSHEYYGKTCRQAMTELTYQNISDIPSDMVEWYIDYYTNYCLENFFPNGCGSSGGSVVYGNNSCVINHSSCSHDTNCGLTCDGVYRREIQSNPGFVPSQSHYDDWLRQCVALYFPDGCGLSSGSSFSPDSSTMAAVAASNEVLAYVLIATVLFYAFASGFSSGNR